MRNGIFDMKQGIKTRLESIRGLRVITYEPEDTRICVVRDDASDPSGEKFGVTTSLTPLAAGT